MYPHKEIVNDKMEKYGALETWIEREDDKIILDILHINNEFFSTN